MHPAWTSYEGDASDGPTSAATTARNPVVVQYSQELLQGTFYTPELMVCGDVTAGEIEHLWRKAERCGRMKCWEVVYSDPGHRETVRPVLRVQGQDYDYKEPRQEL